MSLLVTLDIREDLAESLADLQRDLLDKTGLNARIAGDAEKFIKARGRETSTTEHRTANKLGATPTGHLADAYEAIESHSDADSATLLIPPASRLRAAFGTYDVEPKTGKFLTIPTHKDSYGRRAREFDDLFVMARPGKALMLARRASAEDDPESKLILRARPNQRRKSRDKDARIEVLYILLAKTTIPEDRDLIPFDDLKDEAIDSGQRYIDESIEAALTTS